MSISTRKKIVDLMDKFENDKGHQPSKIKLTSKIIMDFDKEDVGDQILAIIVTGIHNNLIGKRIFRMEITEINANKLKVW